MKSKRLPQAIYDLRQKLNLSQAEFAAKLGVTAMSVSRWEAGTNNPPADCTAKMALLSDDPAMFWFLLGQIGLAKRDFAGRL